MSSTNQSKTSSQNGDANAAPVFLATRLVYSALRAPHCFAKADFNGPNSLVPENPSNQTHTHRHTHTHANGGFHEWRYPKMDNL